MNKDKIIISLCGGSGAWEKNYKDNGYTVFNITLPDYNILDVVFLENHICFPSDILGVSNIHIPYRVIYGILAAPPCTHFSFARTRPKSPCDLRGAMETVIACLNIIWKCQYKIKSNAQRKPPLKFWALENPKARLQWFLGKPAFEFQPYEFGDGYSKSTALWGDFKKPTKQIGFNFYRKKFEKLSTNELRSLRRAKSISEITASTAKELRAVTPAGFARAFFEANK